MTGNINQVARLLGIETKTKAMHITVSSKFHMHTVTLRIKDLNKLTKYARRTINNYCNCACERKIVDEDGREYIMYHDSRGTMLIPVIED